MDHIAKLNYAAAVCGDRNYSASPDASHRKTFEIRGTNREAVNQKANNAMTTLMRMDYVEVRVNWARQEAAEWVASVEVDARET